MTETAGSLDFTGPFENPETPGYHHAMVGGGMGPFGQLVSLCTKCGALLLDHQGSREGHTLFHEQVNAIAKWVHLQDPTA